MESVSKKENISNPEQRELIDSAIVFVEYLTSRWSQTESQFDPNNNSESIESQLKINYYISGSLAMMLLSESEKFTEMDESEIPHLIESETRRIPFNSRKVLASFARQIGDLDFVPVGDYKKNPKGIKKGGGGPSFAEIPEGGRKVLNQEQNQAKLMCDPVPAYGTDKIAKINVAGKEYYIARPDSIFAYKVLHLLQNYDQKPEKFNNDFGKILEVVKEIYSEKELDYVLRSVLSGYESAMEKSHNSFNEISDNPQPYVKNILRLIEKLLDDIRISPEIRSVVENLQSNYK